MASPPREVGHPGSPRPPRVASSVVDAGPETPSRADRLAARRRRNQVFLGVLVAAFAVGGVAVSVMAANDGNDAARTGSSRSATRGGTGTAKQPDAAAPTSASTTSSTLPPPDVLVDPASVGKPWGTEVDGLLTFRGNPTRTWYGKGPVPSSPGVLWQFPDSAMCSPSSDKGVTKVWCGTGWTGEPAVFERDGRTWVVFGAYDRAVHFLDADTGERILGDFPTGDIIKGTVTIDPDGYPIVYTGSRDGYYRVLAIDRPEATELWKLSADAVSPTLWNDDWDGSGLILRDFLIEGGENSQFHVARLNRAYGADGLVTVAPSLVFNTPSWDDQLLADIGGSNEVSVENSVAIWNDIAYFANSGGLVQGWDLSSLRTGTGTPSRVFRFWTGDDTDASVVVDEEGMLYVASEWERHNARSAEIGQIMKLDPSRPDDPLVWSLKDQVADKAGVWGTPALYKDLVVVATYQGTVYGIDRATGEVRWEQGVPGPLMGSPVIVDGVWIQGGCDGVLRGFDVSDTSRAPAQLWEITLGGCIESTPAVWKGRIYVGTRAGYLFALGDA